jgi:hypothetical protein
MADRGTWGFYVWQANQLGRRSEFRRFAVAIADELERVEVLMAQDLEALIVSTEENGAPRSEGVSPTPAALRLRGLRSGSCNGAFRLPSRRESTKRGRCRPSP